MIPFIFQCFRRFYMSKKQLLSLSLLTFILQSCGDTAEEKKLKNRNAELNRQNTEMLSEKDQSLSERDAALAELTQAQDELIAARQDLNQVTEDKAAAEKAKLSLQTELAAKEKSAKELNQKIKDQDRLIADKESQIEALRVSGSTDSAELANLQLKLKAAELQAEALKTERDQLKTSLADANGTSATVKAELEAQLAAKEKLVQEKESQIVELTTRLDAFANPDLEKLLAEIDQLKLERSNLQTARELAEAASTSTSNELKDAQSKLAALEGRVSLILQKSLADVRGLWLNQDQVTAIADVACYEFVHVGSEGSFAQAIACRDGRIQIQKHSFDRFSAAAVPDQSDDNDYFGAYGFAIDGTASSSSCQNPENSILKTGKRLVFEMTRQDFGRSYGALISKNMVVSLGQGFKGFSNASLNFVSNKLDYAPMAAIANVAGASDLSKAAATFIGALQNQGTGISVGCFDSTGVFTAGSSN